jgi:hypothetical protein
MLFLTVVVFTILVKYVGLMQIEVTCQVDLNRLSMVRKKTVWRLGEN